jgi:hypothetical protein
MGDELWYVKLANGDVHRVTIDQLDGAFQAGHIDESTMVLAAGASQWTRLGDIAGLDDEANSGAEAPAEEAAAPQEPAHAEQAHPEEELPEALQVQAAPAPAAQPAAQEEVIDYVPQRPPPAYVQQPSKPASVPKVEAAPGYIPQRPAPAYVQQQVAPRAVAAAPASPAPSYVPPAQGTPYAVSISTKPPAFAAAPYVPNSLRPMSMDLDDLDDVQFPRKSRTGRFVAAVVGLAAVAGGVGFAAQRAHFGMGSSTSDLSSVAAAAAVAPPPPVAEPVAAPPPPPAPAPLPVAAPPSPSPAAGPAEASPMNPQFTSRFNEDTTKKLISADKAREAKAKARHSGGGGTPTTSHSKSTTFTTGGSKFDPLNSSI